MDYLPCVMDEETPALEDSLDTDSEDWDSDEEHQTDDSAVISTDQSTDLPLPGLRPRRPLPPGTLVAFLMMTHPAHLVPKKDGTTRAVADYRQLNSITRKDAHPIPKVDDILYNIGSATWVSQIDLFRGYHQLKLHPDSIEKSAFTTPFGLFA
eukprot:gene7674-7876_t